MAKPNQAARTKRDRERMKQEWQNEKQERRAQKADSKQDRAQLAAQGIDPDLVGITPGPQRTTLS